jgi:ComF family protein
MGEAKMANGKLLQTLTGLTQLCLESLCPLCQRSTAQVLCPNCHQQLQRFQLPHPEQFWQPPLPVFAWGSYGGSLKRAIATLKYDNHPELAQPLGEWLAQQWLSSSLAAQKALVVVPIPLHFDKQQQRGFNQAERVAKAFCQRANLPLCAQGLVRSRFTTAQFGLSATDRAQNLSDAFQLGPDFLNRHPQKAVLLLDDIFTTGATTRAAAQTLRRHRISVYGMVVVAKTTFEQASNLTSKAKMPNV